MSRSRWRSGASTDSGASVGAGSVGTDLSVVLSEFARTMVTDFPIQGILDELVARIVAIMPVTGAGVTLIEPGSEPRFVAASDGAAMRFEQLQSELAEGPCLAAYRTGEAVSVPDLRSEDRFERFCPRALEAGLAAVFTFPLLHGQSRLGALDLYRDTPGPLTHDSMSAAQTLADVVAAYILNAQARSDLQESAEQSREASLHDPLTGLPNRTLMLERLEHASRRGRRSHKPMALFFVDLDRFKEVNDVHGHQVGDELLVAVAERLTAALRPGDSIARMSGDEFVILCEDLDAPSVANTILARIKAVLDAPYTLSDVELTVTASVGSAVTPPGEESPDRLIRQADLAMYKIKQPSFALPVLTESDAHSALLDSDGLSASLSGALERQEFYLDYQPIVDATTGRITGVEALLRWAHPTRGLVPPTLVIPIAEESGAILEIGQWVLKQAWEDRHRWDNERTRDVGVSVNVSAHQFMAAGFADMVAGVLLNGSSDPHLLTLEVTESVFIRDTERAIVVLNALKGIGVTLALDDFGTGYCSLSQILDYPVDTVKIDRKFVADLAANTTSETIVTAVIHLAHGLGMTVVSEGVETIDQHNELTALGTDACQGFYFARPMSTADIATLLENGFALGGARLPFAD
jgi:diguanylate cyclase (GGDEF)-like protein